jgi:tryptophanyl-tRNA synthetase
MRIYNRSLDISINSILFYLTIEEAKQFLDSLKILKNNPNESVNFSGTDCNGKMSKSISVKIYSKENLNTLEEKIINLIQTGQVSD